MVSEAQKRAKANSRKKNEKQLNVTLYPGDQDIIDWLEQIEGKAEYVRRLIREDMAKQSK